MNYVLREFDNLKEEYNKLDNRKEYLIISEKKY